MYICNTVQVKQYVYSIIIKEVENIELQTTKELLLDKTKKIKFKKKYNSKKLKQ